MDLYFESLGERRLVLALEESNAFSITDHSCLVCRRLLLDDARRSSGEDVIYSRLKNACSSYVLDFVEVGFVYFLILSYEVGIKIWI